MRLALIACLLLSAGCASVPRSNSAASPYLIVFAGDKDEKQSDFFAVLDVRPDSPTKGRVAATLPTGMTASMPHHMEYALPGRGELLFANAHHHEATMLLDVSDPLQPKVERSFQPPKPLRFGHDFARLPNGKMLLGFLRSEGPSPLPGDTIMPGGHGGIAEYSATGELIRLASAAAPGVKEPVRPYAFVPMLDLDRIVTTSAPMMEDHSADVVQVWRYSDFKLLHTIAVPPGQRADGSPLPGAARFPFGPRLLADGSILMNAYGCGFYRLTDVASPEPKLEHVYTIQVPDPPKEGATRGACSIPVIVGKYWIMPVGRAQTVVVLDISDPRRPKEVSRLNTPKDFNPHWAATDPGSDRIIVGAELGGEQGLYMLRFDPRTAQLRFDESIVAADGRIGYLDLEKQDWPHGATGPAWAHAALFLRGR